MALNAYNEADHPRGTGGKFTAKAQAEPEGVALDAPAEPEHPEWHDLAGQLIDSGMEPDRARMTVGGTATIGFTRHLLEAGDQVRVRGNQTAAATVFIAAAAMKDAAAALAAKDGSIDTARAAIRRADQSLRSSDSLLGGIYLNGTDSVFATSRKALGEVSRFLEEPRERQP